MTTVSQTKHDGNMEITGNVFIYAKLLIWITLMNTLQTPIVKGFPSIQNLNNAEKRLSAPTCGGDYVASCTGQLIVLPKYNHSESTYCEWTIRTPNPKLTIGLSYVGVNFNYWIANNLKLDIYDGPFPSVNTPKLSSLGGTDDLIQLFTRIESSSSHIVFINFTSSPSIYDNYRLEFSIAYYLCGGTINTPMVIDSPRFNWTEQSDLVPTSIKCVWRINRPENYLFGHIRIHDLNTSTCDVVTITVVGGRLGCANTCYINTTEVADTTLSSNVTTLDQISDKPSAENSEQNVENQTLALCKYYNVEDLAFSGVYAVLTYEVFFNGTYVPNHFHVNGPTGLGRSTKNPTSMPWYLNYAPVAIYVPLGLIFGLLIIYLQVMPRKLVTRTRVSVSSAENALQNSSIVSDMPMTSIMKTNKDDEVKTVEFDKSNDELLNECKTENNNIGQSQKSIPSKKIHFR